MNRIKQLFQKKPTNILSVFFTAGFPAIDSTMEIIQSLQEQGADMIEVGIPFSDPLADGKVIQQSSEQALRNGMQIDLLFEQTSSARKNIHIPLVLMGYLNPIMQYGIEKFLQRASENGFDAVIIPDLPLREYETKYKQLFECTKIAPVFLISPDTSEERVRKVDDLSDAFIYMITALAITGTQEAQQDQQPEYFKRIASYQLKSPVLAGFGINGKTSFEAVCSYTNGAIIGSAFIKAIQDAGDLQNAISNFIKSIKQA